MATERIQRRIEQLLDQADQAMETGDWETVRLRVQAVLALDPGKADAIGYRDAADRVAAAAGSSGASGTVEHTTPPSPLPESFANGRYQVLSLLGEGGRKRVYRAHDGLLDRDVAFALIKTEGLDAAGHERVTREAQALGRLGSHPHIVTVHDLGEEAGQPYIVTELLSGGDLAKQVADAPDHRLALPRVLDIATAISKALAFAHDKGVIHRDLKPGNVWLAQDGTPKLGDFGLAIADADPRLTQAGLIAGTALYMAPEQATGGEVTPRSDLYSLGCLLYELVTGRPPFVGDESVTIIGQHLHANPVSPSWHRPDCPPALEALILRLLAKDPAQRPASASDVAEALAGISPTAKRTTSESRRAAQAPSGPSPVYRRAFVGREAELRQLEAAFDAAVSGQGGLVMVVGEPGIGKTSLTEQLATYAGLRGGRVLVGHCYEEGSLSLPYLPFVEALRSYVLDREPGSLRSELGSAAPEVARIVSEVRDRVRVEPAASSGDGAEDRYRLFSAVSSFLRNAAQVQPLVVVLEDLHDADRGTLDLLQFLARHLSGARLLVVGTYRDVEVDRQHRLSATLAELRRGSAFSRVLLRGLTADEVQRMVAAIAGQDVPWQLAETVHRQTEGNPLFVQEVVRYLAESGLVQRQAGSWQATSTVSLLTSIPEGLRDVIGRRLSRLSAGCNRVLTVAAVIGRDFALATLQAVAGVDEETLVAALEEAVGVAVLQDQSRPGVVRYRFAHAFFRQTLYEEIITPRRLRLHHQVARTLEAQYAARLDEHAAELAEHFAQSSDPAELAKAVQYARLAAERAQRVYAYGEAVRLLEQALAVQEVLDPEDQASRFDLLLTLGAALMPAGEPQRVADAVAPEAFALAEALRDEQRAAQACEQALLALIRYGAFAMMATPQARTWAEGFDRYAAPGTVARVYADIFLALARRAVGDLKGGDTLQDRALPLARQLADPQVLFEAAYFQVNVPGPPERWPERYALAEEFADHSAAGRAMFRVLMLRDCGRMLLAGGDRRRAERLWRQAEDIASQAQDVHSQLIPLQLEIVRGTLDGRLSEVVAARQRVVLRAEELGMPVYGRQLAGAAIEALLHRGEAAEALSGIGSAAELAGVDELAPLAAERARVLAHLGRQTEAQAVLARLRNRLGGGFTAAEIPALLLVRVLEAAVLLGDRPIAAQVLPRLRSLAGLGCFSDGNLLSPGRLLGAGAALLGERKQALTYYQQALAAAAKIGFRPEIALTRLALAELLAGGDGVEQQEAHEHMEFCIPECEAMGMQPALERVRALQVRLHPPSATGAEAATDGTGISAPIHAPAGQVFISYSSDDHAIAFALDAKLQAEQIPVWIDKRSIPPGSSWDAEIVRGIRQSAVVAVLVSPKAMASDHVRQELRLAMEFHKPVVPLLVQPTEYPDEVKYVLAGRQWIEVLERPREDWLGQVLAAVRRFG